MVARVDLTMTTAAEIDFRCGADSDNTIRFSIVVVDEESGTTVFTSDLLSCASTQSMLMENLACNKEYTVSARFAFRNGTVSECFLSNTTTLDPVECLTTPPPTSSK